MALAYLVQLLPPAHVAGAKRVGSQRAVITRSTFREPGQNRQAGSSAAAGLQARAVSRTTAPRSVGGAGTPASGQSGAALRLACNTRHLVRCRHALRDLRRASSASVPIPASVASLRNGRGRARDLLA
jgi:hypothetical protein